MRVGFLTFDRDRSDKTGSARIRATNLIKYGDEFETFSTGIKYDAVVFQKYYWPDYAAIYPGIKIMDICDPDWLTGSTNHEVVRNLELMDGVVTNTEATAEYMRKLTDKPVRVVEDRHDMALMKEKKQHKGKAKSVIWFGYSHNAHVLKPYIPKLIEHGLQLKIMADKFVTLGNSGYSDFKDQEDFVKFPSDGMGGTDVSLMNQELIKHDFALLPSSRRPQDQYKSNNKTTHAWAVGLPVAHWGDDIDRLMEATERIKDQEEHYDLAHSEYDCKTSVEQYREFIAELMEIKDAEAKTA